MTATGVASKLDVKIVSRVDSAGTETRIDYAEGDPFASFDTSDAELVCQLAPGSCYWYYHCRLTPAAVDWYDQQTLGLKLHGILEHYRTKTWN